MFANFKTRKLVVNFFAAVALCLIIGTEMNSIAHVETSRLLWLITYVLRGPSADGIPFQVDLSTSRSKSKSTSRPTTMQPVYSYSVI